MVATAKEALKQVLGSFNWLSMATQTKLYETPIPGVVGGLVNTVEDRFKPGTLRTLTPAEAVNRTLQALQAARERLEKEVCHVTPSEADSLSSRSASL